MGACLDEMLQMSKVSSVSSIQCYGKIIHEQVCIPVGCVPSAAVAVCWGGGVSVCVCPNMYWDRHPP